LGGLWNHERNEIHERRQRTAIQLPRRLSTSALKSTLALHGLPSAIPFVYFVVEESQRNNTDAKEKPMPDLILKDECYKIMGACFEVYKEKGNGFFEAVYQE
jgi:hypothetical protein